VEPGPACEFLDRALSVSLWPGPFQPVDVRAWPDPARFVSRAVRGRLTGIWQ
jgi:hypothetical protein